MKSNRKKMVESICVKKGHVWSWRRSFKGVDGTDYVERKCRKCRVTRFDKGGEDE